MYTPCEAQEGRRADVTYYKDITLPESGIQVMSSAPAMNDTDSILAAEVVVVGGRGAESEAVSYTHLDVYKRQPRRNTAKASKR